MVLSICACGNNDPIPTSTPTQGPSAETTTAAGTEATTEAATEAATQSTTVPVTEATQAPATEPATEAPTTEPATEAPTTEPATDAPTTEPATEAPITEPELDTYSVTISRSAFFGGGDFWKITNVYAESTLMSDGCELRVLYATSGCTATMLCDFYPTDYPYLGGFTGCDGGPVNFDSDLLSSHGHLDRGVDGEDDFAIEYFKAGSYYDLPSGSWFFGDVAYDMSFIIVVDNYAASQDGTVPAM